MTGRDLGFIQEIISRLFQAHCRRPVPSTLLQNTHFQKNTSAVFLCLSFVVCVYLLFVCVCVRAHLCGAECGTKRRLGCVDINGFTMECVKAWELVAAKLHSTLCTLGGTAAPSAGGSALQQAALKYQQIALQCTAAACSITIMGRNIKGRNYQPLPPLQLCCFPQYLQM